MDKLVAGGHSFGGLTAITAARNDARIKVCLPMDPWFFPYKNDIEELACSTAIFSIRSETWYDYNKKYNFDIQSVT